MTAGALAIALSRPLEKDIRQRASGTCRHKRQRDNALVAIELNHTIVPARDGEESARWFTDLFGMPEPRQFGHFWQVPTANGVDLDFDTYGDDESFTLQHYAFLVSDNEFDAIFARVRARGLDHWADPGRRHAGRINHHDGGRGVYFPSNDDHLLEIITRPYGG